MRWYPMPLPASQSSRMSSICTTPCQHSAPCQALVACGLVIAVHSDSLLMLAAMHHRRPLLCIMESVLLRGVTNQAQAGEDTCKEVWAGHHHAHEGKLEENVLRKRDREGPAAASQERKTRVQILSDTQT